MRTVLVIIGIALVALGLYVAVGEASYSKKNDLVKVGSVGVSVNEPHQVPVWAGVVGIVAGGVLIVAGARRRV